MTNREIETARGLLRKVGREITETMRDARGDRTKTSIVIDGIAYHGNPKVFSSLEQVKEYCRDLESWRNYLNHLYKKRSG